MNHSSKHIGPETWVLIKSMGSKNKVYLVSPASPTSASWKGCVVHYGRMGKPLREHTYPDKSMHMIADQKSHYGIYGGTKKYEEAKATQAYCPECKVQMYKLEDSINNFVHICVDCGQTIDSKDDFALAVAESMEVGNAESF